MTQVHEDPEKQNMMLNLWKKVVLCHLLGHDKMSYSYKLITLVPCRLTAKTVNYTAV